MRKVMALALDGLFLCLVAAFLVTVYYLTGSMEAAVLRGFAVAGITFCGLLLTSLCRWLATDAWLSVQIWWGRKRHND